MKLALGTAQFGLDYGVANRSGQVSRSEAAAILQSAVACGIDTVDTAIAYGDSETCLGETGGGAFRVVTKLPEMPEGILNPMDWVESAIDGSLFRLKTSSLYGVLLHKPMQLLDKHGERIFLALQELKDRGVVRKIGVSVYGPSELDLLLDRFQLDLVQAPFNILDQRIVLSGWMQKLHERGIELHVRSVFLQGLLLMERARRPAKFDRWSVLWGYWDEWLRSHGITPLQACIRYALRYPEIARVVIGVESKKQLLGIISDLDGVLPDIPSTLRTEDYKLLSPTYWADLT